jgi:hypothetical protein
LGIFKFPGAGQKEQPVITFPGAIQLAMFLPGEAAKKNRLAMADILRRYSAGNDSPIDEIEAISFDEIVPGATIRFTIIDGVQYLSIRDFIMHACGISNDHAGDSRPLK